MKKIKFLKSIAVVATFMVAGSGAFAQNVATPVNAKASSMETANSDYVTVGSVAPYFVTTDATIQAMTTAGTMKQSVFKWQVTDGAATPTPVAGFSILKYDGSAAAAQYDKFRATSTTAGYFDNEIGVKWDAATYTAGTKYQVSVAERSVTLSSTVEGCEDATPEVKNIYVLARPTVKFDGTEGGGCGIAPASSFYVPLKVTGLGSWTVKYTISYNGGTASAETSYDLTATSPTVSDATVISESTTEKTLAGTSSATPGTTGLKIDLPSSQYGYYDIAITDVNDVVSKKALNALTASPATGTFRIYVMPTPSTNSIQHVKNL